MARPLVLNGTFHPKVWTPVYADIADPKITDWLWDKKERNDQKERYWIYRRNKMFKYLNKELRDYVKKSRKHAVTSPADLHKYRLMTSVSTPVYNKRENAVSWNFLIYIFFFYKTFFTLRLQSSWCSLIV